MAALGRVPAGLEPADPEDFPPPEDATVIRCRVDGWVSQLDVRHVLGTVPGGTVVRLETRIGAYIHAGEPLFTVWPAPEARDREGLSAAVEVSNARTMLQDVDFAIRQLVDIGLRALSPAVNDPTTAEEVILRLGSLMRSVLTEPLAPQAVGDSDGRVLVQPWNLDHDELLAHAFDQIRQTCLDQPHVAATLLRVLRMLVSHVRAEGDEERVPALERQMRLLLESLEARGAEHPEDLAYLRETASDETDPADHSR